MRTEVKAQTPSIIPAPGAYWFGCVVFLSLLFFLIPFKNTAIPTALADNGNEKVSVSAEIVGEGPERTVRVTIEVPPEWYLYHHMMQAGPGPETDELQVAMAEVDWPEPSTKHDPHLEEEVEYYDGTLEFDIQLQILPGASPGEKNVPVLIGYQACNPDVCFMPERTELILTTTIREDDIPEEIEVDYAVADVGEEPGEIDYESATAGFTDKLEGTGLGAVILLSFLAGLALSLTPCVYPMIPVTVALIGASKAESRASAFFRSIIYVLGISIAYSIIGVVAAASGAAFGLQFQHPYLYLALAVLFFIFSFAMFGFFEINLPAGWQSKAQIKLRGKSGMFGLLLLGMVSGIVISSCAAPVIFAAIGFIAATADFLTGFLIFAAIAWGMGIPLVLAGTFSGVINNMPSSGRWQEVIKNVMGLGLVGASLYFLYLSALLTPEAFIFLLCGVLIVISVFSGAFDRLSPESGRWERVRKAFGLLCFLSALYLFIPQLPIQQGEPGEPAEGIIWHESVEEGIAEAENRNKPIMLYFTAEACAACRRMERGTFTAPEVVEAAENFIAVKYDATGRASEVESEYGVRGVPTVMLGDSSGNFEPRLTEVGFLGPGDLVKLLKAGYKHFHGGQM